MAMHRNLGALIVALAGITLGAASSAFAEDAADKGAAREQGAAEQGAAREQGEAPEEAKAGEMSAGERGAAGEAGEAATGEAATGEAATGEAATGEAATGEAATGEAGEAEMGEVGEAETAEAGEVETGEIGEASEGSMGPAEEGEAAAEEEIYEEIYEDAQIIQLPQHLIADTSLFIANASNTARVLHSQLALHVSSPQISSQASYLVMSLDRALASMQDLNQNALATHPEAVPAIRSTIAQLTAARAQARHALVVVRSGELGPTLAVALRAANDHLRSAAMQLRMAAYRYGHQALVLPAGGALPHSGMLQRSGAQQQYGK